MWAKGLPVTRASLGAVIALPVWWVMTLGGQNGATVNSLRKTTMSLDPQHPLSEAQTSVRRELGHQWLDQL